MSTYEDTDARDLDMFNAGNVQPVKFTATRYADRTEYYWPNGDFAGVVRQNMAAWPLDAQGAWARVIFTSVGNTAALYKTRESAEAAMVDYLSL